MTARARGLCDRTYRGGDEPALDWRAVVAAGSEDERTSRVYGDRAFLRGVVTLSRVEWSLARGAERESLARLHARAWERLKAVDPRLVDEVGAYELR